MRCFYLDTLRSEHTTPSESIDYDAFREFAQMSSLDSRVGILLVLIASTHEGNVRKDKGEESSR